MIAKHRRNTKYNIVGFVHHLGVQRSIIWGFQRTPPVAHSHTEGPGVAKKNCDEHPSGAQGAYDAYEGFGEYACVFRGLYMQIKGRQCFAESPSAVVVPKLLRRPAQARSRTLDTERVCSQLPVKPFVSPTGAVQNQKSALKGRGLIFAKNHRGPNDWGLRHRLMSQRVA